MVERTRRWISSSVIQVPFTINSEFITAGGFALIVCFSYPFLSVHHFHLLFTRWCWFTSVHFTPSLFCGHVHRQIFFTLPFTSIRNLLSLHDDISSFLFSALRFWVSAGFRFNMNCDFELFNAKSEMRKCGMWQCETEKMSSNFRASTFRLCPLDPDYTAPTLPLCALGEDFRAPTLRLCPLGQDFRAPAFRIPHFCISHFRIPYLRILHSAFHSSPLIIRNRN
jgi:hypothetical protein